MAKNCEEYVLEELDNTKHELGLQKKKNQELIDEIKDLKRERDELVNAARVLAMITDNKFFIEGVQFKIDTVRMPKDIYTAYCRAVAFARNFDYVSYDKEIRDGEID